MTLAEDPDELARKMLQLPSDWWRTKRAASTLLQVLKGPVIPLLVAGPVGSKHQFTIYTGVLFRHGQTIVWLTAGHAVEELIGLLSSQTFKPSVVSWLDGYDVANAEGVQLHRIDIPMKSWRDSGLDIGVILPSLLDIGNLLMNDKVQPINATVWKNLHPANPEGYYAIGIPRPWTAHSQSPAPNKKVLHSVKADLACLPLSEVPPPPELAHILEWTDPEAFYGKILPFSDDPAFEVDDVKGMSGGPILSVEREPDGRIGCSLVGVIQSWAPSQSIIRAEPIHKIAKVIEAWLVEQNLKPLGTSKSSPPPNTGDVG